ncbi:hypothetical protein ACIRSS_13780 [Amycolatopsis sp. NPDC101161]|uniref:hypothetical protein n=1 Tax=Amycolatopsis sp. NPDC101161 TaxID=3363940 RepID=UPI0037F6B4C5
MSSIDSEDGLAAHFKNLLSVDVDVSVRQIGLERIYFISVPDEYLKRANEIAADVEALLSEESGSILLSVRPLKRKSEQPRGPVRSLDDPRVDELVKLLTARSRTSEAQPSLAYIPNNTANLAQVISARHNLIFGRRGAGKTALLIEARRQLLEDGFVAAWSNAHPLRSEGPDRIFLGLVKILMQELVGEAHRNRLDRSMFFAELVETSGKIEDLLEQSEVTPEQVRRLIPSLQVCIKRATSSMGSRIYFFVDDFYYVPRPQQPDVLDLLHASTRDADVWLKIASIRHLSRWYRPSPPVGLQTGQDVNVIDLDLSLQDPSAAVEFLGKVLDSYCRHAAISTTGNVIARNAVDRLVFASGGVPRDFLTLTSSAINKARSRSSARTVGLSDVNQAAGDAAKSKIGELEDDLASNTGFSSQTLQALSRVREFCLDVKGFTYFRVDFRDKERNPDEYGILSRLLDVRLVHLIDASVSDGDRAGERSECYALDLSQYSGYRLKQNIRVLDLNDGKLVSKKTRPRPTGGHEEVASEQAASVKATKIVGTTARQVVGILRGAPQFSLAQLSDLVRRFEPLIEDIENFLRGRGSTTVGEIVLQLRRPYEEIIDSLAALVTQKRVTEMDADGVVAYRLVG